jgi:poly(3-hydroxybutyrate) depolymerase
MTHRIKQAHHYPEVGIPFFWPLGLALGLTEKALDLEEKNMKFLEEVEKTEIEKPKPEWASPNEPLYSLHTFTLRDFSRQGAKSEIPTLILAPYAGHTSTVADFHKKQSLVETLLEHGVKRVAVTDWHSATREMKDYDIDNYLAEVHVVVSDLGGRVNLIGLCQGGWMSSLYAARYPANVASMVLAGSPIDTQAGNGAAKEYADTLPFSFFEVLVATGGGLLKGSYMLRGFKNMHPQKQYVEKYVELYEHIDDPDYVKRIENFERWYEYTINLPGRLYLQAVRQLFMENLFVRGKFVGLGKTLDPRSITCPLYLLAGEQDDITPKEQVFNAEQYFGTAKTRVVKDLAKGGHIGLFMGTKALSNNWPKIAAWLAGQEVR